MNAEKPLLERVQLDFPDYKVRLDENDKIRFNAPELTVDDLHTLVWSYGKHKPVVKRSGTGVVVIFQD